MSEKYVVIAVKKSQVARRSYFAYNNRSTKAVDINGASNPCFNEEKLVLKEEIDTHAPCLVDGRVSLVP